MMLNSQKISKKDKSGGMKTYLVDEGGEEEKTDTQSQPQIAVMGRMQSCKQNGLLCHIPLRLALEAAFWFRT